MTLRLFLQWKPCTHNRRKKVIWILWHRRQNQWSEIRIDCQQFTIIALPLCLKAFITGFSYWVTIICYLQYKANPQTCETLNPLSPDITLLSNEHYCAVCSIAVTLRKWSMGLNLSFIYPREVVLHVCDRIPKLHTIMWLTCLSSNFTRQ